MADQPDKVQLDAIQFDLLLLANEQLFAAFSRTLQFKDSGVKSLDPFSTFVQNDLIKAEIQRRVEVGRLGKNLEDPNQFIQPVRQVAKIFLALKRGTSEEASPVNPSTTPEASPLPGVGPALPPVFISPSELPGAGAQKKQNPDGTTTTTKPGNLIPPGTPDALQQGKPGVTPPGAFLDELFRRNPADP